MKYAKRILDRFGSAIDAAQALGVSAATIYAWRAKGHIPAQQQQAVLDAARRLGLGIRPDDFFDDPTGTGST